MLSSMIWHYKEQIRNIFWAFIILTHPSVLQELDFIIGETRFAFFFFKASVEQFQK